MGACNSVCDAETCLTVMLGLLIYMHACGAGIATDTVRCTAKAAEDKHMLASNMHE
jgi:hypothetical protein